MSLNQAIINQSIALSALAQSIRCVQQLAWKGQTSDADLRAVVSSLTAVDSPSAASVYGGSFELNSGLRLLSRQLDPKDKDKDPEFVNLAINVIALQAQLQKDQAIMARLGSEIDTLSTRYQDETIYSEEEGLNQLLQDCSTIYQNTLSKMALRIQVRGEPHHLQKPEVQFRVRASLLAAIRAVFLWRQSGGSRWHFLFKKKTLIEGIRYLIANPIKE